MNWYAVRTIFHFGIKDDGKNIFEERVVAFEAKDADMAFEKAEIESKEYACIDGEERFTVHPDVELYVQDGEQLIDGYEVWSELYETNESIDDFYENRYEKYRYYP